MSLAIMLFLFTSFYDIIASSDPSGKHQLPFDLNETPPPSPPSEGKNLSIREKKFNSVISPHEFIVEGRMSSGNINDDMGRDKLAYDNKKTSGTRGKSKYYFAPGTTYKEKKKVWNRECYKRDVST